MMRLSWLLFFALPFGVAQAQAAVDQLGSKEEYIICRNSGTVRTIRVDFKQDENQCVTLYTKSGVDKEVARGQFVQSCSKIADNIRENLEKASWSCKEVQNASFSSTSASN